MGSIERTTCKKCGKSWQYKTGCGVSHWNLNVVLDLFDEDIKAQVKSWADGKEVPLFRFDYCKASCSTCRAVVGVPVLKLFPENTLYVGKCENCGSEVSVPEETSLIVCPECGGQTLESCREGLWD